MQFTPTELWANMGLFARLIVAVMAVMSLASLGVAGERLLYFRKSRRDSVKFAEDVAAAVEAGGFEGAAALKAGECGGYIGRTLGAGFAAYRSSPREFPDLTFESVARALERQSQREVQEMKKGLGLLATVSSTAPFVGLLGTVMGIVTSFEMMAKSGSGGLGTVSAGIAEALVTTAFGLIVAIPAVMIFNYLQGWTDGRSVDISESSNELLDALARYLRVGAQPESRATSPLAQIELSSSKPRVRE